MNSPLARVILATLSGYLLILLFLSVYDWVLEEYPRRPIEPMKSERIQHQLHHQEAIKALRLFSRLPEPEKAAIKKSLESNLISIKHWRALLKQSKFQILCLGELHEESTRHFLSKEFFANFSFDVLLLEATSEELKRLIKRVEAGREYFPLLDADIMSILRSVTEMNPDIKIFGIEQTDKQAKNHRGQSNPRDQSIAQNFWDSFEPGLRHIILFGALHCSNESNWLFHNLCSQSSPRLKDEMLNVRVVGEHQNGPVEAFVYFMDEIGIEKRHFVISDTRSLPDHIYKWFPLLDRQILEKYRSLVVFRT
jgi:hypothetical protein